MAKKKPGKGKGRKPRKAGEGFDLPDPRTIEAMMRQMIAAQTGVGGEDTSAHRAQDLMYDAFEQHNPARRQALARQALDLWPDCADAYFLLGEQAPSLKEALRLYEQGVAAGERALGARTFHEDVGHFWGLLETRPYMRTREALAHALWADGRREEAVAHLQDMLRLNPNDNQGLRYTLAAWLLSLDRDADLAALLKQYEEEGSATWAYTRALLAFRQGGDTPEARRLLKEAKKVNKHVPDYLLGHQPLPSSPPEYIRFGDTTEAIEYAGNSLSGWRSTPNALAWLREATTPGKRTKEPGALGPSPLAKERLRKVPQSADVWQGAVRQLPGLIETARGRIHPWVVLLMNASRDLVMAHDITEERPGTDQVWDKVAGAVQKPLAGRPHRPSELQLRPGEGWEELKPHLEEIGIRCVESEELSPLDEAFAMMVQHLGARPEPGLLDIPDVGADQAASFFQAAASYYRQAPWRRVGYESAIRIESDQFEGGPWYAVVMGQSGMVIGLTLYDDLKLLQKLWANAFSDEENARRTVATTVLFGEEGETPLGDVEAARRLGWEVAGAEAWPTAFRKERGKSMRPPTAAELALLDASLRAVPTFVQKHRQDDPAVETITVPSPAGERTLRLSWVPE